MEISRMINSVYDIRSKTQLHFKCNNETDTFMFIQHITMVEVLLC